MKIKVLQKKPEGIHIIYVDICLLRTFYFHIVDCIKKGKKSMVWRNGESWGKNKKNVFLSYIHIFVCRKSICVYLCVERVGNRLGWGSKERWEKTVARDGENTLIYTHMVMVKAIVLPAEGTLQNSVKILWINWKYIFEMQIQISWAA